MDPDVCGRREEIGNECGDVVKAEEKEKGYE